jgi:hypothetical protein
MASRSCRLNASRICFNVSVVTLMAFEWDDVGSLGFTVSLWQADRPHNPVDSPKMKARVFKECWLLLVARCVRVHHGKSGSFSLAAMPPIA